MPIILILFIVFSVNNVFGQGSWKSSGNDIYYIYNDGKVGIGTFTPKKLLHITADHNSYPNLFPVIRLENIDPKSLWVNIWDIRNEENLYFDFGESEPLSTLMVLTKDGQLSLGTETPGTSAIMQINSNDKGLLIPRMTTPEKNAISSPVNALLVFDTDLQVFSYYDTNAGEWLNIAETSAFSDYLLISDFNNSVAGGITQTDTSNWNAAYNWTQNFTETDPIFNSHLSSGITEQDTANWNTAFSWGNHAEAGYLTSMSEIDPIFSVHLSSDITEQDTLNWNTTFSWGDHSAAGYITDGNTNWNNEYGFITAASSDELTNKTGNISMWTNDVGYITEASGTFLWGRQNNNTVLLNPGDNLGLGTNNPKKSLHIYNQISEMGFNKSAIRLHNYYTTYGKGTDPPPPVVISNAVWDIENNKNTLDFKFGHDALNYPVVTKISFDKDGKIGIGTSEPQTQLHIINEESSVIRLETNYDDGSTPGSGTGTGNSNKSIVPAIWDIRTEETTLHFDYTQNGNYQASKIKFTKAGKINANQLNIANGNLTVDENGNVGIGSDDPGAKLWVEGRCVIRNLDGDDALDVVNDAPKNSLSSNTDLIWGRYKYRQDNNPRLLHFSTWDEEKGSRDIFTIKNNGQVGIGTKNPVATLDIDGDLNFTGMLLHDGEEFSPSAWQENENHIYYSVGNVGIGTSNPVEKFQIGDRWTFHNGGTKVIGYNYDSQWPDGSYRITDGYVSQIRFTESGHIHFKFAGNDAAGSQITDEITSLSLTNSGNVGIGTSNPNSRLHIKYGAIKISGGASLGQGTRFQIDTEVSYAHKFLEFRNINGEQFGVWGDGTVKAKKIKVQSTWSDFVFEPDYKLTPLNELETYINNNKHLPDIPTEQEIIKDGLDLGDMQKLQMQKIEELTLYIIELNKRIESLEKENSKLKNK